MCKAIVKLDDSRAEGDSVAIIEDDVCVVVKIPKGTVYKIKLTMYSNDVTKNQDDTEKSVLLNGGKGKADGACVTKHDDKIILFKSKLLVKYDKIRNGATKTARCKYRCVVKSQTKNNLFTKVKTVAPRQGNDHHLKSVLETHYSNSSPVFENKKSCQLNSCNPQLNHNLDTQIAKACFPEPIKRKSCHSIDEDPKIEQEPLISPIEPIQKECQSLENLKTTDKKIGFLGLGAIGQRIVSNLLKAGHNAIVYNRSQSKCDRVVKDGATRAHSPAEVIMASDITFCCVSGPEASKSIFFSENGVLTGLKKSKSAIKGYVELSSIDEETSQLLAREVESAGGVYLEAPMNGTVELAEEAKLVIAGAGSKTLFESCATIFSVISKRSFFVSKEVGKAAVMNLGVNMLAGAVTAAFGETKIACERLDVFKDDLVDSMNILGYKCPLTKQLREGIKARNIYSFFPVQNLQTQMHLGFQLKGTESLPMLVMSTANEVLKREKSRVLNSAKT